MRDMPRRRGTLRVLAATAALAFLASACRIPNARGGLGGTVNVDGSSTVFPITEAVAEEFQIENPGAATPIGVSGTGGGFSKFCNGETDIQDASRAIKESEEKACREAGVEWVELSVAFDGIAVVVNPANDWVDCLTTQELSVIWSPGSQVERWSQVRPGFPDVEMDLFGPGTDSGTFDYFTDEINGEEGASRIDYTGSEDDNTLVQGVSGDRGGLAYFGLAFYEENQDKLKLLGVDPGDGCVQPSVETVQANTYRPLSRPLFIYVSIDDARSQPIVRVFVDFYLDVVNLIARDVGYIPLDEETLQQERAEWRAALGEVDADGS